MDNSFPGGAGNKPQRFSQTSADTPLENSEQNKAKSPKIPQLMSQEDRLNQLLRMRLRDKVLLDNHPSKVIPRNTLKTTVGIDSPIYASWCNMLLLTNQELNNHAAGCGV